MSGNKKLILEALKDQREIFGDDLFGQIEISERAVFTQPQKVETVVSEKIEIVEKETVRKETPKIPVQPKVISEGGTFENASSLDELNSMINTCLKCSLGSTRTKFVFGVGNPNTDAMLIGEAPGADEDKQGEPFVGRAGKLLNDILLAINFQRSDVYIANILKCRPPNNRDPLPMEMETCKPYLMKQIELIKPKVILCLGRVAANALLDKKMTLGAFRENNYEINGIQVVVTYHPAALLRNPNWKRGCWEDVKKFRKIYDELTGNKNNG